MKQKKTKKLAGLLALLCSVQKNKTVDLIHIKMGITTIMRIRASHDIKKTAFEKYKLAHFKLNL